MRLINIDDIMRMFPNADIDADAFDNLQAYPHWKTDITGLINILKQIPTVEMAEDCVKREDAQDIMARLLSDYLHDEDREKIENANAEIGELPSVQPQPKTLSDAEINTFVDSMKNMRKATKEESKSTVEYIDSISKPTGFLFDEAYEELVFVEPHKKLSTNLQPCEDCISREEAINVVHKYFVKYLKLNDDICLDGIRSLPSVQPQPKRGKWEVIRKEYEFMGGIVNEPQGCKCSNCGGIVKFKSDFCPSCGSYNGGDKG